MEFDKSYFNVSFPYLVGTWKYLKNFQAETWIYLQSLWGWPEKYWFLKKCVLEVLKTTEDFEKFIKAMVLARVFALQLVAVQASAFVVMLYRPPYGRVVTQLFWNTGMEKKTKIRSNIWGFSRRKRGNTIEFVSNTGREI